MSPFTEILARILVFASGACIMIAFFVAVRWIRWVRRMSRADLCPYGSTDHDRDDACPACAAASERTGTDG